MKKWISTVARKYRADKRFLILNLGVPAATAACGVCDKMQIADIGLRAVNCVLKTPIVFDSHLISALPYVLLLLYIIFAVLSCRSKADDWNNLEQQAGQYLDALGFETSDTNIRCAIWLPDPAEDVWYQATRFIPTKAKPDINVISSAQGLVGRAIRLKEPQIWICDGNRSEQEYRRELVESYGFTQAQSLLFAGDRRGALAIPVIDSANEVIAVLQIDHSDPGIISRAVHADGFLGQSVATAKLLCVEYSA